MKKLPDTPERIYRRKAMARYAASENGRAAIKAYKKKYAVENADALKVKRALYYEKNRDKLRARSAEYYLKNREKLDASAERRRRNNMAKINACARAKYKADKAPFAARNRKYALAHPHKVRARIIRYRAEHGDKINAITARRRATKKHATPVWANPFFISEAYHLATLRTKVLGFKWQVDHIVPLQSKIVCGLHVENNLRVIPSRDNMAKGNRYWPDMPA